MDFECIKNITDILQSGVIICATIFTAWWTYRTFSDRDRVLELKELKKAILLYHSKVQMFCAQVRDDEVSDDEVREKVELAQIHNRLVELYHLNLFINPDIRQRVQDIVGKWIANERLNAMQRRGQDWSNTEKERVELWQQFDKEFKEVLSLIDNDAKRKI